MNDAAGGAEPGKDSARAQATPRDWRSFGDVEIALLLFVLSFAYFGLTLGRTFDLRDEGYIYYGVKKVAERIVGRGPQALDLAKQAARRGAQMSLAHGLALEADLFGMISSTDEMKEGMAAFLQKRDAAWKRR